MTDTVVIAENEENTGYRFSWGLAIAGGVAATAVIFFLLTLGSGFGLLLANPVNHAPAFLTGGAIYFFVAQAFGFAVGGHLAGRLLGPLLESDIQEEFRAAAHGLLAWAATVLATLIILTLAGLTVASTGAATAALYGAQSSKTTATPTAYLVDVLFRPEGASVGSPAREAVEGEAARILNAAAANGEQLTPDDRGRLVTLVSAEAGISPNHAAARVDRLQNDVRAQTRHAADIARKAASYASLWIAFSLLFGALVAMFASVHARAEDDREAAD